MPQRSRPKAAESDRYDFCSGKEADGGVSVFCNNPPAPPMLYHLAPDEAEAVRIVAALTAEQQKALRTVVRIRRRTGVRFEYLLHCCRVTRSEDPNK
jgi:hypothetical protein